MLCRCKGKSAASYVRSIAIPASSSYMPRTPSSTEKQPEDTQKREDEVWKSVLKAIPTSSRRRTAPAHRAKGTLDPNFFSSRQLGQSRKYTTDVKQGSSGSQSPPAEPESLFNSTDSAWDHVFDKIDNLPPLHSIPTTARPRTSMSSLGETLSARRQRMSAREIDVFDNMFNMIFDAANQQDKPPPQDPLTSSIALAMRPRTAADRRMDRAARHDPLTGVGIGSGPDGQSGVGDLLGKLKRVSRKFRWSEQEDAELERKMAQMELCETDLDLLEWAEREVFAESVRYEEAARQAVLQAESKPRPKKSNPVDTNLDANSNPDEAPDSGVIHEPNPTFSSPLPLQPPAYPHLLAGLMRSFRDKFNDPHLALSIFAQARSQSTVSFVFGCTVPAYNELLRTRWTAFRDLRGVADALSEMRANGIAPNGQTRGLVEELRREVGARTVWQEERNIGTGEVMDLLHQIETLSRKPMTDEERSQNQRHTKSRGNRYFEKPKRWRTSTAEQWKAGGGDGDKKYKFGDWKLGKH